MYCPSPFYSVSPSLTPIAGTTKVGVYDFNHNGRTIYLVDTPGFDDTNRPDSEILQEIALFLAGLYTEKIRLAGLIYLHRITDTRVSGSSLKNIRVFQSLCGADAFKLDRVILATTMWSTLDSMEGGHEIGVQRSKELEHPDFWGQMLQEKKFMREHDGSKKSALSIISELINRKGGVVLQIQKEMVDRDLSLEETDAGRYLQKDLIEARERYEKEITELKKNLDQAKTEKDAEAIEIFEQERESAQFKVETLRNSSNQLKLNLSQIASREHKNLPSWIPGLKDSSAADLELAIEDRMRTLERQLPQLEKQLQEYKTQQKIDEQEAKANAQYVVKVQKSQIASLEATVKEQRKQLAEASKKNKKQPKSPTNNTSVGQFLKDLINFRGKPL